MPASATCRAQPLACGVLFLLGAGCTGGSPVGQGSAFEPLTEGAIYQLKNRCSQLDLSVAGGSLLDGAAMEQRANDGSSAQQWRLHGTVDGKFELANVRSGKLLDVSGSSTQNGTAVIQREASGGLNQRFAFTAVGGGSYKLNPSHAPGQALDVSGASTAAGATIQIGSDNGACTQQWTPVLVWSTPPLSDGDSPSSMPYDAFSNTPVRGTSGQVKWFWFAQSGRGGSPFDNTTEMVTANAQGAYIAPDGKIITCGYWDENTAEAQLFQGDGSFPISFQDVHPGEGPACTIGNGKAFISSRDHNGFRGVRRFPLSRSGSDAQAATAGTPVGLAVVGTTVFAACDDQVMRAFDANTMAATGQWSIPAPHFNGLVAVNGKLALLSGNTVQLMDTAGHQVAQLAGLADPHGLGVDNRASPERLIVALGRGDHRLAVYDLGTLAVVEHFGVQGGIYATNAGGGRGNAVDKQRLLYPRAARIFPDGSWSVLSNGLDARVDVDGIQGGTMVRKFASKAASTPVWDQYGNAFSDLGVIDPTTWVDAYTVNDHYKVDQATGKWFHYAHTLDTENHPDDVRDAPNHDAVSPWIFYYGGKRFLVTGSMYGGVTNKSWQVYRQVEETFVATGIVLGQDGWRGLDITPSGVFFMTDGSGVRRRAVTGLDAQGDPLFSPEARSDAPPEWNQSSTGGRFTRFFLDEATDTAYVSGWVSGWGAPGTHDMEKMIGNGLGAYAHWSTAGFSQRLWMRSIPASDAGGGIRGLQFQISMAQAGDYLFTVETARMLIRVYRKSDGALVKEWIPGSQPAVPFTSVTDFISQYSTNAYKYGWSTYPEQIGIGVADSTQVFAVSKHPNGVYNFTLYDNGAQKVIWGQWTP